MFTLVVPPESPCGCESGKRFGDCHLKDGRIITSPKWIDPPGEGDGRGAAKCVLSYTKNCGGGISGDHFVSAAVLREIVLSKTEKVVLQGPNFRREHVVDSDSLKTKRLCKRHNSAFSPIDTEAGRFFRAVYRAHSTLKDDPLLKFYFFNGIDIERWLLKTMIMVYYAGITGVGPRTHALPNYAAGSLLVPLPDPYGLYFPIRSGDRPELPLSIEKAASVKMLTEGGSVVGVTAVLCGLPLTLMVAGAGQTLGKFREGHAHRPPFFNFFHGQDVISIGIVWEKPGNQVMWLSRGDPNAAVPAD